MQTKIRQKNNPENFQEKNQENVTERLDKNKLDFHKGSVMTIWGGVSQKLNSVFNPLSKMKILTTSFGKNDLHSKFVFKLGLKKSVAILGLTALSLVACDRQELSEVENDTKDKVENATGDDFWAQVEDDVDKKNAELDKKNAELDKKNAELDRRADEEADKAIATIKQHLDSN